MAWLIAAIVAARGPDAATSEAAAFRILISSCFAGRVPAVCPGADLGRDPPADPHSDVVVDVWPALRDAVDVRALRSRAVAANRAVSAGRAGLPSQSTTTTDLRANYFAQRRWFFGLLAFLLGVSLLKDLVLSGSLPNAVNVGFHAAFLAASVVAFGTQREAYHQAAAALTAAAIVVYIGLLFAQLQ